MKRGFTLIELMIAVALIGIAVGTLGGAAGGQRRTAAALVAHERALQLLEAQADLAIRGRTLDPARAAELLRELPGGALSERRAGGVRLFAVSWRGPSGPRQLELPVLERAR